jgi:hypothetical protein
MGATHYEHNKPESCRGGSPALPDWHDLLRAGRNVRLPVLTPFTPNSGECLSKVRVDAFRVPERTIEY